ncbi:MAG: hypothetical protein ACKPGT_09860, partial [Microcystis sp.]
IKTMQLYDQEGWIIIGITNQGGVAAGHKSLKSAIEEQRKTLEIFPLLSYIYFCPDFEPTFRTLNCHRSKKPLK